MSWGGPWGGQPQYPPQQYPQPQYPQPQGQYPPQYPQQQPNGGSAAPSAPPMPSAPWQQQPSQAQVWLKRCLGTLWSPISTGALRAHAVPCRRPKSLLTDTVLGCKQRAFAQILWGDVPMVPEYIRGRCASFLAQAVTFSLGKAVCAGTVSSRTGCVWRSCDAQSELWLCG